MEDNTVLELWYAGVGDLYRKNHGLPGNEGGLWLRLHDNPRQRLIGYIFMLASYLAIALSGFYFCYGFVEAPLANPLKSILIAAVAIVSVWILVFALKIFFSILSLKRAIKSNTNTDLADAVRMRTLHQAIARLIKKGKIAEINGRWAIK